MKGNIQIIQNYGDSQKVIFQEDNMAVDGVRRAIADIMTYMPDPSSVPGGVQYLEPGVSSVSSYQIQAMSLGSAKGYYDQRDTRFWYSAMEYSSYNYQQLPLRPDDYFEMYDCYSGIGYNSWKYDSTVNANILKSPQLTGRNGVFNSAGNWEVLYKEDPIPNPISVRAEGFGRSTEPVTRFELVKGQQAVTIRQEVPLSLGGSYYLYTNGKAYESTFDFRVARGRNGIPFEYYDFTTRTFVPKTNLKANTQTSILLADTFDVNEFNFTLKGNEVDQAFEENNEYFAEFVFPSKSFIDVNFRPWDINQQNPYVDIARIEICDASHQILKNPNFLTHQSRMVNNDFRYSAPLTEQEAQKPALCNSLGYRSMAGWATVNPILGSADPASEELQAVVGYVKPASTSQLANTVFSSMTDGVVMHTSGTDLGDFSGAVSLSQVFALGDDVRNNFAFPNLFSDTPTNLNAANGQADNNTTLLLSFDTMVSGASTAANSGHLQISLLRNSDGYFYSFSANSDTQISNKFEPLDIPLIIPYSDKDTWFNIGIPVLLPADANRDAYTLRIKASGRTDANGFCNYAIKDFSFGELEGWRTYIYDQSGVAAWGLSSNTYAQMASGLNYSGLSFSGPYTQSYGWSAGYLEAVNNTKDQYKNQIVQNFHGLAPTKSYRLALKGAFKNGTTVSGDAFKASIRTRGKVRTSGKNNILSQYKTGVVSTTYPVSQLNPYSNDGQSFRRTFPNFQKTLADSSTKPTDWGVLLGCSSMTDGSNSVFEESRGNESPYFLSMDVFNSHNEGSYFVLSSAPNAFFNWESGGWDNITTTLPSYRSSTSGAYFLELPKTVNSKDYTSFEYPHPIPFQSINLTPTSDPSPDSNGLLGTYKITAGLFGPNSTEGSTLVKNIKLLGDGEEPNVDIWKDLYYQWDTGAWATAYDAASFEGYLSAETATRNFLCTPESNISNMCFYGLDEDTEYQINIINTSGGEFMLNDVSLTDASLIATDGADRWVRDSSVFTSEFYGNSHYDEFDNSTIFKYYSTLTNVFDPSNIAIGSVAPTYPPAFQPRNYRGEPTPDGKTPSIEFNNIKNDVPRYPWAVRSFALADYDLQGGDTFAFGFDTAITYSTGGNITAHISAETQYQGTNYHYDFNASVWVPGAERREKAYAVKEVGVGGAGGDTLGVSSYQDVTQWTKIASPELQAPTFGPNTKIIATLRLVPDSSSRNDVVVKDFRVYRTIKSPKDVAGYRVSGDTFLFPEFPTPMDETLQSKGRPGTPGELGQFLNRIQYFDFSGGTGGTAGSTYSSIQCIGNPMAPSKTGEVTMEEAVAMGAYLPSAGLFFGSSTFGTYNSSGVLSGTLNTMGVLNSDGYIYQHPHSVTNEFDASAGFITSSYVTAPYAGWTHKPKVVRYALKVHKDDWKFLDFYMGGIGALGLNTFDYKKTYEKLGTSLMVSSTDASYTQGSRVALYNVADPSRNPVFRLTNKKVTFPPGLHIDYQNTDWLTIIWDIDFLK